MAKRISGAVIATHTPIGGGRSVTRVYTSPYKARKWGKEHGYTTKLSKFQ